MTRKFGVEIELVGLSVSEAVSVLRSTEVSFSDNTAYRHRDYDVWKVTTDASVPGGCEVVSRILQGDEGIAELKKVCRALASAGATVNTSCGLHVHVDARDLNGNQLRNVVTRYAKFESEIDSFMPRSRRGSSNTFCGSMTAQVRMFENGGYGNQRWWFGNDASLVAQALSSRYLKVNLQSWLRQRTIEFRHHSGSVNASKIATWVKFLLQFVKQSTINAPGVDTPVVTNTPNAGGDYTVRNWNTPVNYTHRRILRYLTDNTDGYRTQGQIALHARIQPGSVPAYITAIRSAFLVTVENRRGQGYRLVVANADATPAPTPAPVVQPVNPNDTLWAGIDSNIRSYYTERAMELA